LEEVKIITKEDIQNAKENDILEGYVYIKDYAKQMTKNGDDMFRGILNIQTEIAFVSFENSESFDKLKNTDYSKKIVKATLKISVYKGKKNTNLLKIENECTDDKITKDLFCLKDKYDTEKNAEEFIDFLEEKLSDKAFNLLVYILEINEENGIFEKFKVNYAATTNHDNLKGGLLYHSFKCLKIYDYLKNNYEWLNEIDTNYLTNTDIQDLMYLGIALHDIGKTKEINENIYLENSFNTHRVIGAEIIFKYKKEIISSYNEHFYNLLISILIGHHDKYEDKARTIYAFIVHQVDSLESLMTDIDQRFDFSILESPQGNYLSLDEEHQKLFI